MIYALRSRKETEMKIITCSRCGREILPNEKYYVVKYYRCNKENVCYDCMKEINGEDDEEE